MWIILISLCVFISLIMSLMFCACWKERTLNDEWMGVDGMVTQKNPDENVNHLPSATTESKNGLFNNIRNTDKKNAASNSRRSLPDIPSEMSATTGIWEINNGDNSSEHYATLGQYQQHSDIKEIATLKGREVPSSSLQTASDDTFSPYERVKYDKIKSSSSSSGNNNNKEHPYAQVHQVAPLRLSVFEENNKPSSTSEERVTLLRSSDIPSTSSASSALLLNTTMSTPTIIIRSRRSSSEQNSSTTTNPINEHVDIPAATAVAGGIAASYELPYMTPPINFSGDSQDSSKGYTSISVREPLANIIGQTNSEAANKQKRKLDIHYSTVSDDSDDVYTTIPDPNNQIYNSESETYARIPPLPITVEVEINVPPPDRISIDRSDFDQLYEAPPEQIIPSNVDNLKYITHTHSRQASSSSSSANFGSPKPEKRQANSPLPPPPTISSDFDKLHTKRNLDDLYAKVQKNRKDNNDTTSSEEGHREEKTVTQIEEICCDHNYETLKKSCTTISDFGYERIKGGHHHHHHHHQDCCEPGYASINGPESLANSSDPGYEALRVAAGPSSSFAPSQVRLKSDEDDDEEQSKIFGYSVVNKKKNSDSYITTTTTTSYSGDSSDPNYESVNNNNNRIDPNYESVQELLLEPYYQHHHNSIGDKLKKNNCDLSESSNNSASNRTADDNNISDDPPYERLKNNYSNNNSDLIDNNDDAGSSSSSSSTTGNEIENEETDDVNNLHDENAVVEV